MVHIGGREPLQNLHYIREVLEAEPGMEVSYPNVVNYLVNFYLKER